MIPDKTPEPVMPPASLSHPVSQMLALLKAGRDVRIAKIRRLRSAVKSERFENELKLDVAAERLLREL